MLCGRRYEPDGFLGIDLGIANIATTSDGQSRGTALEDLTGIRERARLRKLQRVTLSSWAFAQLGSFIEYKALRAGVPAVYVDPAWTSRTCAACGHAGKRNRVSQARFTCRGVRRRCARRPERFPQRRRPRPGCVGCGA